MLEELLRHVNNWFEVETLKGEFVISDGSLKGVEPLKGQYYRIVGSILNDGLHQHPEDLIDETWTGEVRLLAIPKAFLTLASEIEQYEKENKPSAMQSESFGGYSYSRMSDADGSPMFWPGVFRQKLNAWRKL